MSFLREMDSSDLPDESYASFWEHVDELRSVIISALFVIVAGVVFCLCFYAELSQSLLRPLDTSSIQTYDIKHRQVVNHTNQNSLYNLPDRASIVKKSDNVQEMTPSTFNIPPNSSLEITYLENLHSLALLSPLEGMVTTLKICFWGGITLTSPFWIFIVMRFIAPAFNRSYRQLFLPFLGLSMLFAGVGFFFAYCITLPLANEMLLMFNDKIGMNLWSFSSYIDYTLLLLCANILASELMLILFLLVHFKMLDAPYLQAQRRPVILLAFIVAALLTPPDVLTQVLLAVPLIGLYELAIIYAKLRCSATRLQDIDY